MRMFRLSVDRDELHSLIYDLNRVAQLVCTV